MGNRGSFRMNGRGDDKRYAVLFTTGEDKDWPDQLTSIQILCLATTKPRVMNSTTRRKVATKYCGTRLNGCTRQSLSEHVFLLFVFHSTPREVIPRNSIQRSQCLDTRDGRDGDLVAVWKTTDGQRFQNYKATFTILDVPVVPRAWLESLRRKSLENAPPHGAPG